MEYQNLGGGLHIPLQNIKPDGYWWYVKIFVGCQDRDEFSRKAAYLFGKPKSETKTQD